MLSGTEIGHACGRLPMETAPAGPSAPRRSVFEDGLGKRHALVGTAGESLEVFEFRNEFSQAPAFEFALRERVAAMAGFQNSCFSRVRTVQRLRQHGSKLVVLSERAPGTRLSTILATAKAHGQPLELNAALCLIRQLVPAIAMLHEKLPGIAHGAISAERMVITPQARVVVVDHVLGSALEQLHYPQAKYWTHLGVPLPKSEQVTIDQRVDVLQIGIVALSLILGRAIDADEYPEGVSNLADGAWCVTASGGVQLLPAEFRIWLRRMLQIDEEQAFRSAVEAWAELEQVLRAGDHMGSFAAFEAFMTEYARETPRTVETEAPPVEAATPAPADVPASPRPVLTPVATTPVGVATTPVVTMAQPTTQPTTTKTTTTPTTTQTPTAAQATTQAGAPVATMPTTTAPAATSTPMPVKRDVKKAVRLKLPVRPRWMIAAAVIVAVATAGVISVRQYFEVMPAAVAEVPGTLVIDSTPTGVRVLIDGQTRGVTPLTVQLNPGPHEVILASDGEPRTLRVNMTAGSTISHSIDLPKVGTLTGQLTVRTDPPGARVAIDDAPMGTTPMTINGLVPGSHTVTLTNDVTSVKQSVTIDAGATASLVVPMTAPQGVPVSGWISVTSPAEVQIYEGGRLLGSSRTDRLMVSAGTHELEVVNESLGYRSTRSVIVSAGKVSPVRLDWPNGTMAINAHPWAEVWVDGERVGETPIGSVTVPIGTHEVVFRHPQLGQRVVKATVTANTPARVGIDLTK